MTSFEGEKEMWAPAIINNREDKEGKNGEETL
jgi:hypothetical protein